MFESLESRTLLSVSLSGGTLTITGTPGKDNIVVAKKSRTVVQVTGAGPTKTYTTATFSGYRLSINGGDGDDTITINGNVSYKSAKIFGGKG